MSKCCPEEDLQQSSHSCQGVVQDHETLGLVLIEPMNWQNDAVTAAAFSKSKLKEGTLSIFRREHATADMVRAQVVDALLLNDPGRCEKGVKLASCADVRAILTADGQQAICVVDDGRENYPAHTHMGFSRCVTKTENKTTFVAQLADAFARTETLEEVFLSETPLLADASA